jgi:hypothetical protein
MSLIKEGGRFPNMFLKRPDGTCLELYELWKKEHGLVLFVDAPHPDTLAFIRRFQDEAKIFEWLNLRLIPVYPELAKVHSPWPAPLYAPFVYSEVIPEELEWGKGYLFSKNRTVHAIYPELPFLSAHKIEQDMLYYEARHC